MPLVTKIEGTVTITAAGGNPDSAQLKTINDATNATIIVPSKAVALSGTAAVLAAALDGTVTDAAGDKIEGNVTIANTPTEAQLKTINDATNCKYSNSSSESNIHWNCSSISSSINRHSYRPISRSFIRSGKC